METFPAIVPDHPATKEVKPREQRQGLGDGLEYVVRFGLNPMDVTWRLTWARLKVDELFEIEQFLEARAADGQPFLWTPPDTSTAQAFRVDQWEPARSKPTSSSLDLVFRRVYEVVDPILVPEPVDPDVPPNCTTWIQPTWDESVAGLIYDAGVAAGTDGVPATALSAFGLSSGKWYFEVLVAPGSGSDYSDIFVGFAQNASTFPGGTGSGGFGVGGSTGVFNDLAGGFTEAEDEPFEDEAGGNYYRADDSNSELRLAVAIDLNAKRFWLGAFDEATLQWNYDGNPVTGTSPSRSGWTGTPTLRIAVGLPDFGQVSIPTTIVITGGVPPTGFCFWPGTEPTP